MDFRQPTQPSTNRPAPPAAPATVAPQRENKKPVNREGNRNWMRILSGILLIGSAILIAGIALAFTRSTNDNELRYVDHSKYQAVFLNNGQVYFGNIDNLNSKYVRLSNIFYLTQSGTNTSNYSLVKLGCQQIHDPYDQMLINRDQVTFWENLQNGGTVVTNIKKFQKDHPNGPDCSQVSNQTQASGSSSSTQGSNSNSSSSNSTNGSSSSSSGK